MSSDVLISLVGGSPIPVVLGCRDLAGPETRHVLICSSDTRTLAEKVRAALGEAFVDIKVLSDVKSPERVSQELSKILLNLGDRPFILHYTGGTKVMSAIALVVFGQDAKESWYLDDHENVYHNLTGRTQRAGNIVSMSELAGLHGYLCRESPPFLSPTWGELRNWYGLNLIADENAVGALRRAQEVLPDGWHPAIKVLLDNRKAKYKNNELLLTWSAEEWDQIVSFATHFAEEAARWFPSCRSVLKEGFGSLVMPKVSPQTMAKKDFNLLRNGANFVSATWLEDLVRQGLRNALKEEGARVLEAHYFWKQEDRVNFNNDKHPFAEIDCFLLFPNRLVAVSVTMSQKSKEVKAKLDQATSRSQDIGGNIATSRVVAPTSNWEKYNAQSTRGFKMRGWVCGADFLEALVNEQYDEALDILLKPPHNEKPSLRLQQSQTPRT